MPMVEAEARVIHPQTKAREVWGFANVDYPSMHVMAATASGAPPM
jgi:hypothetical protein